MHPSSLLLMENIRAFGHDRHPRQDQAFRVLVSVLAVVADCGDVNLAVSVLNGGTTLSIRFLE